MCTLSSSFFSWVRPSSLKLLTAAVLVGSLSLSTGAMAEIVDDFDELEGPETVRPPAKSADPDADLEIGGKGSAPGKAKRPGKPPKGKKPTAPGRPAPKAGKGQAGKGRSTSRVQVVKTAPEAKDKTDRNSPITYKADKVLTFKTKKDYSVLNLVKNVFIRQGRLTLSSQRAKVYLRPVKGQNNAIDSITIDGNVQVQKNSAIPADRVAARGDRAVFKNAKRTVVLTGNAVVVKGEQVVRGDRIRYDLRSGNITISGAKGTLKPGGLN